MAVARRDSICCAVSVPRFINRLRNFVAAPGHQLLSADYSQIELRLMAHFSQDPLLLNAYRTDQDIHTILQIRQYRFA